jgi:hypothetical protein
MIGFHYNANYVHLSSAFRKEWLTRPFSSMLKIDQEGSLDISVYVYNITAKEKQRTTLQPSLSSHGGTKNLSSRISHER